MSNKISNERKAIYYTGLGLIALGVILFFSSFFTAFTPEPVFFDGPPSFFKRAVIGMICIIVGSILTNIGAKGTAGSGLILDPEKAREDLKPFSSAAGGMINDVIEEIDVVNKLGNGEKQRETKEIIKIRCRQCSGLNDDDAKFCKECGKSL